MPDRHRVQRHHETGAAQQEKPRQRDDERLYLAEVDDIALQRAERKLRILPIIRGTGRRFAIPIIRFMGSGFLSCARKTPTETDIFA
jgi:hypothetical protein